MPITELLNEDVQRFLHEHEHDDDAEFVLKHKMLYGVPASRLAQQLKGRKKAREKLPLLYASKNIIYPPQLNLEQSSSEMTAIFKSTVLQGRTLVDLTGGFGIDSFFFSKTFDQVHYVEQDAELLDIARHNTRILGADRITFHLQRAETFLKALDRADVIYIDPSRRKGTSKIVKLSDCSPDITVLQSGILKKSSQLLVKTSPLLDIQQGMRELNNVSDVYVVSVNNECREILFVCGSATADPLIQTVNLLSTGRPQFFNFTFLKERATQCDYSPPIGFVYEPNASILKAGAFKSIGVAFGLNKISANTHLYTSAQLVPDFPGRIFKITAFLKPDPSSLNSILPERKANILTRNYPLPPDQLKKKMKVIDGGDNFILAFSGQKEKYVVLAVKAIGNNFTMPE